MKRYLLFGGRYAKGGWNDFLGGFDSGDVAAEIGRDLMKNQDHWIYWWHVLDSATEEIIAGGVQPRFGHWKPGDDEKNRNEG